MKQINNEKAYQSNIFNACFFGSFMKNYKPLSILYLAFLLLAISNSAFAIDLRTYVPHTPGNQWSWVSNNYGTKTVTVGSPVTLPSGVVAIPSTIIDSSRNGSAISYSTIDANGLRKWQEYMSDVYIPNYGYTSGKIVYSPGLVIAPANVSIGSTYTSNGKATLTYTNISSFVLNYASSTKVVGFETVSNNSGTQSWSALKIINSVTFSGTVNGQFYTQSAVATSWLVDGLGNIKSYQPNDSQVMETWKLTDTNVTPVPIITSISPTSGTTLGDTAITITGTNLTGATSVKVNGVAATSVVVVSATSITAKTPAGTAGAKSLTVTTAGGTATKASAFTYVVPAPTITSIAPTSGTTLGGTAFTIKGTNLTGATIVKVNGVAATSVVVVSATSITARTPAGTAGAKSVAVTTAGGTATKASAFTYVVPAPTITSIAPTSGTTLGGTAFTITGTNLTGATSVKVNGVAATSVVVVSATSITAKTPAGTAGAKSLTVTTAGGTATKASAFTYIAPPAITSIAPVLGTIDGGTTLRITGTNFSGATRVKVGTREAINFTVISSTQLQCDSPVGNSGVTSITVTTPIGDGTKANAFTYVVLVPRIKSIVPNTGTTLGDTSVIINGDNLSHATSVMFGSALATNVHFVTGVDGKIAISANTPVQGFGLKNVVVSTAGGTATKTSAFTYLAVAPTGVTASTNLCTTINVAWDSYVGATGYQVFRDSNLIETVGLVTTFSDWYGGGQYSIKALGAFGISLESASVYGSLQTGPICDGDWPPHLGFTGDDGNPIDPAPMGVQLYLQTVQQLPDVVFVKCSDTEIAPENMKITNALVPTTNDPSLIISDQVQTPQIAPANTIEIVGTLLNPESAAATPPTIKNLPEISLAKESGPTRIRPIDLDQDGQADICQLRGGDFDLNGLIDDRDMSILLHMIGTEPLHGIGDLDGNGLIDSADMSLLLLKM